MATAAKTVAEVCREAKDASHLLARASREEKDACLRDLADRIDAGATALLEANRADVEAGHEEGLNEALIDRLTLTEARIAEMAKGVREIADLDDPVGEVVEGWTLENGLEVAKKRVPIGVVAVVYEARPNVTIDAAALCLKSGNAAAPRGSSSAESSNAFLALALIDAAQTGLLAFARLVGDDRVHLEPRHGRLLVKPAAALEGLIEVRGLGIRRLDHEPVAVVGLVVDLAADDAERLPEGRRNGDLRYYRCRDSRSRVAWNPVCAARRGCVFPPATLNLRHDPCSPARRHKSNGNAGTLTTRSRSLERCEGRSLTAMQHHSQTAGKALARGLRMVMMAAFRAVQPGTRRRGASMIGLVLVTHGRLAVEFRSALEHVVGPQTQIEAVTIGPDDDVEQRRKDIIEAVKRVDSGEGVAILTDMFGGTPVQPRDFGDGPSEGRSARRHQSADAGQARQGAR